MGNRDRVRGLPGKPPWDGRGCTVVAMWFVGGVCIDSTGKGVGEFVGSRRWGNSRGRC